MKNTILQILKISIFLGIGVFLIWYAFKNLKPEEISDMKKSISNINPLWVFIVLIPALLSHIARALRWQILLDAAKEKASLISVFNAVIIGYFANLLVPRMGEITRCSVLKKTDDIDLETSLGTVILERVVDTICLFLFIVMLIFKEGNILLRIFGTKFTDFVAKISYPWYIYLFISVILLFGFWLVFFKLVKTAVFLENKFAQKIITLLVGFKKGLLSIFELKNPILFILYSFFIWFFYWATIVVFFKAFPETTEIPLTAAFSLLVLGSFAYILVQGGIGAYQIIAMQTLALYGISSNTGLAFGWVIWSVQTALIIILGLVCSLYVLSVKPRTKEVQI